MRLIPPMFAMLVCLLVALSGCRTYQWEHVAKDGSYDKLTVQIPPTDTKAGKLHFKMTRHGPIVEADSLSLEDRQADVINNALDTIKATAGAAASP